MNCIDLDITISKERKTRMYKVFAKNLIGEEIIEYIDEDSALNVICNMKSKGYYAIDIVKKKELNIIKKVKKKDLSVLCRQLAVMMNSGISICECFRIISARTKNKIIKKYLELISVNSQKGIEISKSMEKSNGLFPTYFVNMVKVGEECGKLDYIFLYLSDYYEKEDKLIKRLISALSYPVIVLAAAGIVLMFLSLKVIPEIIATLASMGAKIPVIALVMIDFGKFISSNFIYLFLLIATLILAAKYFKKNGMGKLYLDSLKIKAPIIGNMYIKLINSRFSKTLSILLDSGIPVIKSLEIISNLLENKLFETKMNESIAKLKSGASLSETLENTNLFQELLISMITIGEESGSLDIMLQKASELIDSDISQEGENMLTLIEPCLIVIIASIIGFIILSVVIPMVGVMNSV